MAGEGIPNIYVIRWEEIGERQTPKSALLDLTWWRHQMETFSAFLVLCAGNSPVTCEFPAQRPETRSFDVFFDLRLNKRLNKQSWGWWFETPSWSLRRHSNEHTHPKHLVCDIPLVANFLSFYMSLVIVMNCGAGNVPYQGQRKCKICKSAILLGCTVASHIRHGF